MELHALEGWIRAVLRLTISNITEPWTLTSMNAGRKSIVVNVEQITAYAEAKAANEAILVYPTMMSVVVCRAERNLERN